MRNWPPVSVTTDKLGSYPKALRRLKRKGELKDTVRHRTSKYLNNRIEADHGALKRLIRPTRGFQSMKTAYATIKGFEIMRMICIGLDMIGQLSDLGARLRVSDRSAQQAIATGWLC